MAPSKPSKAWEAAMKTYFKTIGTTGGKSKSKKKLAALAANRSKRWAGKEKP